MQILLTLKKKETDLSVNAGLGVQREMGVKEREQLLEAIGSFFSETTMQYLKGKAEEEGLL